MGFHDAFLETPNGRMAGSMCELPKPPLTIEISRSFQYPDGKRTQSVRTYQVYHLLDTPREERTTTV